MKQKFGSETGSKRGSKKYATIDLKPGGIGGELRDTLPVPLDMQPVWQQFDQIQLSPVGFLKLSYE